LIVVSLQCLTVLTSVNRSRASSVSIVSGYGLDDRAIGVRSPAGAKDFSSSLCVQTGSGATKPLVPMVPGVLSPGVKYGWGVTLTTHHHLVPRSWMSRSYTSSPPSASMACSGTALILLHLCEQICWKWNMSSVCTGQRVNINFCDRKYKAWTTARQDFVRKVSTPYEIHNCGHREIILQILKSFIIVFLNNPHSV
jgi:hypothetical protein